MGRSLLVIFLIVLSGLKGYAQAPDVVYGQNLKEAIALEKVDTARITLLQKLGKYYISKYIMTQKPHDIDTAVKALNQAITLSDALHLDNYKYEGVRLIGTAYIYSRDTLAARPYLTRALHYYTVTRQYNKAVYIWIKCGEAAGMASLRPMAMHCYRQALAIEQQHNLHNDEIYIRLMIAQEYDSMDNPAEAIKYGLAIVADSKGHNQNLDRVYLLLSNVYRYSGDIKKALTYSLAGANDMEMHNDTSHADAYYGELGLTYDILGQSEKSILYYRKTLAIREKKLIPEIYIIRTVGFVIKNLIKLGRFSEALAEARSVEARHPAQTTDGRSFMAQNYAYCYQALKQYDKAEKYYLVMVNTLDLSRKNDELVKLALFDIGSFYVARGQYVKAQLFMDKMGYYKTSLDNQKNFELLRFKIDSGMGNYRSALNHYGNYQHAKDSIFNETKSKQIEELQVKYETGQKQRDIDQLRRDTQLQRSRVKQANYIRNLTFAGIVLLLGILSLLYKSYRTNQKKSSEIDLKNASLNQLLTEKDGLLEEKEWLMKEIHHRVKNNLQIVMGLLQRQSSFVNNKDALAAIRNSEHRMHSIALIHQKLYQSDSLTLVNMADYIGEMMGYLRESFSLGTHIRFEKDLEDIELDINIAVPVGLVLNEAITNAIKYAFPTYENGCIRVTLKQTADSCYLLQITDNGRGLPATFDAKKMDSMGFNLMKGLAKQIGGKFQVSNDAGVTIVINFCPEDHTRSA